ncbi:MAG: dihydroxyacetone kinase subunit L [Rhizobiaceae bacterium]
METIEQKDLVGLFRHFRDVFQTQREFLIALDGHVGDSDLGITMNKGFAAAFEAVEGAEAAPIGKTLQIAGMAFAKAAPSTMGTLTATGLMRGGKALAASEGMSTPELAIFWQAFRDGIAERGKAKLGDKTLLDVLDPIANSLAASGQNGANLADALDEAATAAANALEATKSMIAQHGKAACFPEKSVGLQDAGATVGFLIIDAMRAYVRG